MTPDPEERDTTAPAPAAWEECVRVRGGTIQWTVRSSLEAPRLTAVLNNPDAFLTDAARHFKNSRNVTVGRVTLDESEKDANALRPSFSSSVDERATEGKVRDHAANSPRPDGSQEVRLVLRRMNYGRWRHRLRDTFRPTRAERAFRHGLRLEQAGVATPRVLAAGARRILRWPVQAYLITEEVLGAIPLNRFLAQHRRLPQPLVMKLADLIARLHERGFCHRDLKSSNVLLDAQGEPCLIDLDGVRVCGTVSDWRARADLARLAREFSAYRPILRWSGARFLKRYCQVRRLERSFRPWAQAIMGATP